MDHFFHGCTMVARLSETVSPKAADIPMVVPHVVEAVVIPMAAIPAPVPALISENPEGRPLELHNPHPFSLKKGQTTTFLSSL
jgi:hypothetical protein